MTKFFPDEIFPRLSFSRQVFFPDFFSPGKEFILIFFSIIIIIIIIIIITTISYLFAKFIISMFLFDVLYLSWLSKAVLTKISKCE